MPLFPSLMARLNCNSNCIWRNHAHSSNYNAFLHDFRFIIPAISPLQINFSSSLYIFTSHLSLLNLKYIFLARTYTLSPGNTGIKKSIAVEVKAIWTFSSTAFCSSSAPRKIPKQTTPICAAHSVKITPASLANL